MTNWPNRQCTRCFTVYPGREPCCPHCVNPEFSLVSPTLPLFGIELWDHEEQRWSGELAAEWLGFPAERLTPARLRHAIRMLFSGGWSEMSVAVDRYEEPVEPTQRSLFTEATA